MAESSAQTLTLPLLNASDRCDRCGAQAYVLVELEGGSTLLFCGHHWGNHESALAPKARRVVNELHKLVEPVSAG
jgi:hypothetical protein